MACSSELPWILTVFVVGTAFGISAGGLAGVWTTGEAPEGKLTTAALSASTGGR